ncbi:MAG: DUF424 family protein [Candidatus Woesearchaeota archaeon]
MIVNKIVDPDHRLILVLCDVSVHGKKIEDGNLQLDLSSDFYKGEESNGSDIIKLFDKAYIVHAVGKQSVALCVEHNVLERDKIRTIKGIPYAYMVGC